METILWILIFSWGVMRGTILSQDAGSRSAPPSWGEISHILTATRVFTFTSGFRKLHEIFNFIIKLALHYMILLNCRLVCLFQVGFPGGSDCKESVCHAGDTGSFPGSERSPGKGTGFPLQYSCLGNPMDRKAWRAAVCGVTKELYTTWQLNKHSNSSKHVF